MATAHPPQLPLDLPLVARPLSPADAMRLDPAACLRTADVCEGCGAEVEHDADGPCCAGAEIVQVELWQPVATMRGMVGL